MRFWGGKSNGFFDKMNRGKLKDEIIYFIRGASIVELPLCVGQCARI